jgi:hypothetical protein
MKLEPWLDRSLKCGEVAMVLLIALIVIAATCYQTFWIVAGDATERQYRLANSLKMLNENWKVGLILLIPLFYRTIRTFLERVEEFGGMKAPRSPKLTSEGTNPPEAFGDDQTNPDS